MTEITNEAWSAKPESFTGHDHPGYGWGAYVSDGRNVVAKAWGETAAEAQKRAHLIASAPEMFAALERLSKQMFNLLLVAEVPARFAVSFNDAQTQAEAALAKARGEQL